MDLASCEWRKATASGADNGCVEVVMTPVVVGVRDTKDRHSGQLAVTPDAWHAFTATLR